MTGYFEVKKNSSDEFSFNLKSGNHKVILSSQIYNTRQGALGGGTANFHQQVIFRPIAGLGRADTPVRGLFLGSASAHPGGGVHGLCGRNAARAVLRTARLRPWAA